MQRTRWKSWAGALVVLALIAGTARDAEAEIRPGPAPTLNDNGDGNGNDNGSVNGNDNGDANGNDNSGVNGNDNGNPNGNDNGSDLGACCFADGACLVTTRAECEGWAVQRADVQHEGIDPSTGPQAREAREPKSGQSPSGSPGGGRHGVHRRFRLHGTWLGAGTDCTVCDAGNGNDNDNGTGNGNDNGTGNGNANDNGGENGNLNENGAGNENLNDNGGGNANDNGAGDLCPDGSFQVEAVLTPGSGNDARYRWFPEGCEHFRVRVRDFPALQTFEVRIAGILVGLLTTDADGRGELEYNTSDGTFPADFPIVAIGDVITVGALAGGEFFLSCSGVGNCNANDNGAGNVNDNGTGNVNDNGAGNGNLNDNGAGNENVNDNGAGNGNLNDNGSAGNGNDNSSGDRCPDGSFQVEAVLTPGSDNDARYRWFPGGCERFRVRVRDLAPFRSYAVTIAGLHAGTLVTDEDGRGALEYDTSDGSFPPDFPVVELGDVISVGGLTSGVFDLSCSGSGNCNGN